MEPKYVFSEQAVAAWLLILSSIIFLPGGYALLRAEPS